MKKYFCTIICILNIHFCLLGQNNFPVTTVQDKHDTSAFVYGGKNADPNAYPWMVALLLGNSNTKENLQNRTLCGGSLISDRWVLTAAHCVIADQTSPLDSFRQSHQMSVITNPHNLQSPNSQSVIHQIESIIVHPDYIPLRDPGPMINDIALIKLSTPITNISPVSVLGDTAFFNRPDNYIKLIGFGSTEFSLSSSILQEVSLPIIVGETCRNLYGVFGQSFPRSIFCAGGLFLGVNSCAGDSGGPFFITDNNKNIQVGIVSGGAGGNCSDQDPAFNTKVSFYKDWISQHVDNVDITLSINDTKIKESDYLLYTNKETIYWDFTTLECKDDVFVQLFDMFGKNIFSKYMRCKEIYTTNTLKTGFYIIKLSTKEQTVSLKFYKN